MADDASNLDGGTPTPDTTSQPPITSPEPSASPPSDSPSAAPPTPPSAFSLRDNLTQAGYDASAFSDDKAAADALLATVEEFHRNRQLIDHGRLYAQHAEQFNQWMAQQQAGQQPPKSPEPKPDESKGFEWKVPEYDPRWERYCDRDPATGRWKAPDGAPELAAYAQKLNAFYDFQTDAAQRIVKDFPTLVQEAMGSHLEGFQKQIDDLVNQRVQAALQQWETQREARQYLESQRDKLYQVDEKGQVRRDPTTGAEALTPRGLAFVHYGQEAQQLGLTDPASIRTYIERMLAADEAQGKFASPLAATPPAPNGNGTAQQPEPGVDASISKKRRFLRNVRTPDRSGTVPRSTAPADAMQNPDATLEEILDEEARKAGIKPPG